MTECNVTHVNVITQWNATHVTRMCNGDRERERVWRCLFVRLTWRIRNLRKRQRRRGDAERGRECEITSAIKSLQFLAQFGARSQKFAQNQLHSWECGVACSCESRCTLRVRQLKCFNYYYWVNTLLLQSKYKVFFWYIFCCKYSMFITQSETTHLLYELSIHNPRQLISNVTHSWRDIFVPRHATRMNTWYDCNDHIMSHDTGRRRPMASLIFIGHFPQKLLHNPRQLISFNYY